MVQSISQLLSYLVGEVTISAKHLAESSELEIIVEDTGPHSAPVHRVMPCCSSPTYRNILVLTVVSDCELKT